MRYQNIYTYGKAYEHNVHVLWDKKLSAKPKTTTRYENEEEVV